MNATPIFIPAVLAAALCATGCSSPDGTSDPATGESSASSALVDPPDTARRPIVGPGREPSAAAIDSPDAATDGGYFSCTITNDCVAVPYIDNCCYNGWKIAVARSEAEAFLASEKCGEKRPICPEYVVGDTRIPACNAVTRTCEMVPGDAGASGPPALW